MKCVIFYLFGFYISISCKSLPTFLEICHREDGDAYKCIQRNLEIIRTKLPEGIPELYVPPMEPLVIPEIIMDTGANFKGVFKNLEIYNLTNFIIDKLEVDMKNLSFICSIRFPYLKLKADYNLRGRILTFQLDDSGTFEGNITNAKADFAVHATVHTKKRKSFIKVHKDNLNLDVLDAQIRFNHLFSGNEELSEQTNKILNENSVELFNEFKPFIENVVTDYVFGVMEKIFEKYSYDDLLLDP